MFPSPKRRARNAMCEASNKIGFPSLDLRSSSFFHCFSMELFVSFCCLLRMSSSAAPSAALLPNSQEHNGIATCGLVTFCYLNCQGLRDKNPRILFGFLCGTKIRDAFKNVLPNGIYEAALDSLSWKCSVTKVYVSSTVIENIQCGTCSSVNCST